LKLLSLRPELGVISCGYHRIDQHGNHISTIDPVTGHALLSFHSRFMNGFLHSGVVFRRSVVEAVGGYDERYWTAQDSDLWDRLRDHTRFENVAEPLVSYRVSSGSVMKTRGAEGDRLSLTVPQRALSAYIGQPIDLDTTKDVTRLYQGFEVLSLRAVTRALGVMQEVDAMALHREPIEIRRIFRRRMTMMIAKQARRAGRKRPFEAARLFGLAAAWKMGRPVAESLTPSSATATTEQP
jgi:hypothetical protein